VHITLPNTYISARNFPLWKSPPPSQAIISINAAAAVEASRRQLASQ